MCDDFCGLSQQLASHVQCCNGPIKKAQSKLRKKKRVDDSDNINRNHNTAGILIHPFLMNQCQIIGDEKLICFGYLPDYMENGNADVSFNHQSTDLKLGSDYNDQINIDQSYRISRGISNT
jgi:hypothetical protein